MKTDFPFLAELSLVFCSVFQYIPSYPSPRDFDIRIKQNFSIRATGCLTDQLNQINFGFIPSPSTFISTSATLQFASLHSGAPAARHSCISINLNNIISFSAAASAVASSPTCSTGPALSFPVHLSSAFIYGPNLLHLLAPHYSPSYFPAVMASVGWRSTRLIFYDCEMAHYPLYFLRLEARVSLQGRPAEFALKRASLLLLLGFSIPSVLCYFCLLVS